MGVKWIVESVVNNHAVKTDVYAHTMKEAEEYVKRIYSDAYQSTFRFTPVKTPPSDATNEYKWRRDRGMLK